MKHNRTVWLHIELDITQRCTCLIEFTRGGPPVYALDPACLRHVNTTTEVITHEQEQTDD